MPRRQDYPPYRPTRVLEPGEPSHKTIDQAVLDCISRTRLRMAFATNSDNAGENRSRYQNVFHHVGRTMIAFPRNTARRARSANRSGAIPRDVSASSIGA